tara:strand:+ start:12221 stop:13879 length:1659 start_codon:yes stop_codon:yes gene_type:complete
LNLIKLLLIESSENDALVIADYLDNSKTNEYEITHLNSLEDATDFLTENWVDIILINLFLPDSFGIHTFNQLFRKFPNIPFLILTEIKDHLIGINSVKQGAQDFLIKSELNANNLSKSINYAIERKKTEEELRKSEEKYRELFERSKDAIYISTIDGEFIEINPAGLSLFGYEIGDFQTLKVRDLYVNSEDREILKAVLAEKGEVKDFEVLLYKKGRKDRIFCLLSTMVIHSEDNQIIGYQGIIRDITEKKKNDELLLKTLADLDHANKELKTLNTRLEDLVEIRTEQLQKEKNRVENQHKEIKESIQYAKRIQASILPPLKVFKQVFDDSFIFYEPKDVVSGDFYWFERHKNKSLFAIVDCTGHGVPGAFMSIIGYTQLSEIVSDHHLTTPGVVLKELDKRVRIALNQNAAGEKNSNDGMELGLITYYEDQQKIEFSGAMRPLYMVKNGDLHVVKGNKFSIGGSTYLKKEFLTTRINVEKGDCFYLFSDGYADQFGGPKGKKFMTKHVGEMLQGISHLPMSEQGRIVKKTIQDWMKGNDQIDDILMAGIKF